MQNTWVSKKVHYKGQFGFTRHFLEPDDEQLKEALDQIVEAANKGGWTVTALACVPSERITGMEHSVTLVATLSKP